MLVVDNLNAHMRVFCRFTPKLKTRPQAHVPEGGSATRRLSATAVPAS